MSNGIITVKAPIDGGPFDLYSRTADASPAEDRHRPRGGDGVRIAAAIPAGEAFVDRAPASGVDYAYDWRPSTLVPA